MQNNSKNFIKGANFVGKKIGNAYEKIKHNIIKGKNTNENKEKEMKDNPPNLNNQNIPETGRSIYKYT